MSPSFHVSVSEIENYKNEINESTIFDCGQLNNCVALLTLKNGKQIIDRCNITSNKVGTVSGYAMFATSDLFVKYTTVRSNNQLASEFLDPVALAWHYSSKNKSISVIACNYVENNDASDDGRLIGALSNLYVCHCCILNNAVKTTFYIESGSIVVSNSFTDNNSTSNSVEFISMIESSECNYFFDEKIHDNCDIISSISI